MQEGTFITVEGIDGAGKTLAVKAISEEFDAVTTQEPSEFWTGKQVRKALKNETPAFTDFFLFMADRHYHIEEKIKPALRDGELVVSDRFHDSTLAYQPVQLRNELQFPQQWMERVMEPWNLEPDLTIYLDVPIGTAMDRLDGDEKYENIDMLERVSSKYEELRDRFVHRYTVVDATQSKEEVRNEVLGIVRDYLDEA